MNRHLYYLKRSLKQLSANPASLVIIIFSFTVCVFSLFVLINMLLYSTTFLSHRSESKRSFTIISNVSDNSALVKELLYGNTLPEISEITGLCAYPKGGSSQNIQAVLCDSHDKRLPTAPDVISGRSFTEDDLTSGSSTIIWCNDEIYINSGLREYKSIGDSVVIGDTAYTVIGISDSKIYLPLNTALSCKDLEIRLNGICFAEIPTKEEVRSLNALAKENDCTVKSRSEAELRSFLENGSELSVIIVGIILCVICIVSSLFDYMVKSMLYEYSIYKLLGISKSGLFELLYLPLVIMTALSLGMGYLCFLVTKPLQWLLNMHAEIDVGTAVAVSIIMLAVMLFVTLPKYKRLFGSDVIGGLKA